MRNINYYLMKKTLLSLTGTLLLLIILKLFTYSTNAPSARFSNDYSDSTKVYPIQIPADLLFAGEQVPLSDIEVYERMDRELLVNNYWQSNTLLMHKRANRWFPVIEPILKKYGIPNDFKYIPLVETGMMNLISPAGATGFWQFMEPTGLQYGLEINKEVDERYDVEKSTIAACKMFRSNYKDLGNWTLVAAAYNMGINGLMTQMTKQKQRNYYDLLLNAETSRYVFRLVAIKEIISKPRVYGYFFKKADLYYNIPVSRVKVDSSISNLADFALANNISYKTLKNFNPWMRDSFLSNTKKKVYLVQIPKANFENASPYGATSSVSKNVNSNVFTKVITDSIQTEKIELEYILKDEEDLDFVSKRYNVSIEELKNWNKLKDLTVANGQKIIIFVPQPE